MLIVGSLQDFIYSPNIGGAKQIIKDAANVTKAGIGDKNDYTVLLSECTDIMHKQHGTSLP